MWRKIVVCFVFLMGASGGRGAEKRAPAPAQPDDVDIRCKDACEVSTEIMPTRDSFSTGKPLTETADNYATVATKAKTSVEDELDADVKTCKAKKNFCAAIKWHDYDGRTPWCWKGALQFRRDEVVDNGDEGGPHAETVSYYALQCLVLGHVECVTLKKDPPPVTLPPSR